MLVTEQMALATADTVVDRKVPQTFRAPKTGVHGLLFAVRRFWEGDDVWTMLLCLLEEELLLDLAWLGGRLAPFVPGFVAVAVLL